MDSEVYDDEGFEEEEQPMAPSHEQEEEQNEEYELGPAPDLNKQRRSPTHNTLSAACTAP